MFSTRVSHQFWRRRLRLLRSGHCTANMGTSAFPAPAAVRCLPRNCLLRLDLRFGADGTRTGDIYGILRRHGRVGKCRYCFSKLISLHVKARGAFLNWRILAWHCKSPSTDMHDASAGSMPNSQVKGLLTIISGSSWSNSEP